MQERGDINSIPRLGRCPGGGHGNPLQYSCLENPMDRGAWQATVYRVAKISNGGKTFLKNGVKLILMVVVFKDRNRNEPLFKISL